MKKFIVIFIIFIIAVITLYLIYTLNIKKERSFTFYYPKAAKLGIGSEERKVYLSKGRGEKLEKLIFMEYMLGPLSPELRFDFPVEVKIKNLYLVYPRKYIDLIVNFDEEFAKNVSNIDEWTIKAMLQTLKANTKIKRVLFLSDGKRVRKKIGVYNLGEFIEVRK